MEMIIKQFKAFVSHIKEGTPLGKTLVKNPVQLFFYLFRGNAVVKEDNSPIGRLYLRCFNK